MFREVLAALARALNRRKMPYMVIGGQAVLLYGEPRITKDIDITLGVDTSRLDAVLGIASETGLNVLTGDPLEFVKKTSVLPTLHPQSGIRVDFVFSFSRYEGQALLRVNKVRIGRTKVAFASIEDLVIHKIIAGRPRDLEDVKVLVAKNRDMDRDYVLKWLKEFDSALSGGFNKTFLRVVGEARKMKRPKHQGGL